MTIAFTLDAAALSPVRLIGLLGALFRDEIKCFLTALLQKADKVRHFLMVKYDEILIHPRSDLLDNDMAFASKVNFRSPTLLNMPAHNATS